MKTVLKYALVTAIIFGLCSCESVVELVMESIPCTAVSVYVVTGAFALAMLVVGLAFAYEGEKIK